MEDQSELLADERRYDPSRYDGLYKVSYQPWFRVLYEIFCPCIGLIFSLGILVPGFVVTLENRHTYCDHPLHDWIFVSSIILSVQTVLFLVKVVLGFRTGLTPPNDLERRGPSLISVMYTCSLVMMIIFWIAWHILGTVWIAGSSTNDACPGIIYNLMLVMIILFWAMLGLGILSCCVICCAVCFCICTLPG